MADPENKTEEVVAAGSEEEVDDVEDVEEINTAGGDGAAAAAMKSALIANQLMQSPEVLAALQDKLGGMIGANSGYIQSLPKVVKRRIKALKKLQFEMINIESKFYEEVHELECKYASKYAPLFDKRQEIVTGSIEPTDDDCDWPSDEEEEEDEAELSKEFGKAKITEIDETKAAEEDGEKKEEDETNKDDESTVGIPEFWLTVFKNVDMLSDMIQEHDEPILRHLTDLKVKFKQADPMGFTIEFYFESNEYFSNDVLTKEYLMRSEPDKEEPFSFEGPEITKCKGCTIDWNKGKNVTVKVIKKVQKHKGRGTKRTVTKTVQNDSFFNFFSPPEVPEDTEEMDEECETLLAADFEIGHFIRERVVPRAVLYFTGEALEDDDFDEEEGEEEEGDEDDDDEEDNDPDFNPEGVKGGGNPGECKQQ
jgi:nucleosome assembly protein 1-like 1